MNITPFKQSRQQGLSLVEVLIALVVLSIGLVGMAALHLNSLQSVHSAHYRSMASAIALDFEERLWLEVAQADDDSLVNGCPNTTTVAQQLLEDWRRADTSWEWSQSPRLQLPNLNFALGQAQTSADQLWTQIPIIVMWAEDRFEDEPPESFRYTVRVVCRPA